VTKHHIKEKRNTEPSCCLNHSTRWRWWSAPHSSCYMPEKGVCPVSPGAKYIIYVSGFACHHVSKISK